MYLLAAAELSMILTGSVQHRIENDEFLRMFFESREELFKEAEFIEKLQKSLENH